MNAFGFASLEGPGLINKSICDKFEYYNTKEVDFTMQPDFLSGFVPIFTHAKDRYIMANMINIYDHKTMASLIL